MLGAKLPERDAAAGARVKIAPYPSLRRERVCERPP